MATLQLFSHCLQKTWDMVSLDITDPVVAALKKAEEENEAKRLANRPDINLLQVLPSTCYKEKIKQAKWSEKVAALDALIEAGGEQPYKLCQPSASVNYTPLLRELTQLLSHTHFAVCSKALISLGMLAEGVGKDLFGSMRPLIPTLVALFKDKKVSKAVGCCLDKMFANVLSFEHLLDNKDSLPTSLDEKKQKNALVRKNVLEYLVRCVKASETLPRGDLTCPYAENLSKLGCEKLKDSDASVRKAATEVLLALLSSKDESVVSSTEKITASLETTNPRAYKSLKVASRPHTAPANTSSTSTSKQEPTNNATKPCTKIVGRQSKPQLQSGPGAVSEESEVDDKALPSFEESIEKLSTLSIAKWGDSADNEGILAGIQCELLYEVFLQ